MKRPKGSPGRHRRATPPARRSRLLAAFERSGLSAAAFARRHGIRYTTFCGWRQRRPKTEPSPAFVQVELAEPIAPAELLIDLGAHTRLRLTSARQIDLAVELLRRLNAPAPC
jgi:transposase-like protein